MNGDKTNQHMRSAEYWYEYGQAGEGIWGYESCANKTDCINFIETIQKDAIATERGRAARMREALLTCKATLESNNPGICDTIWITNFETLVDCIDAALAAPHVEQESAWRDVRRAALDKFEEEWKDIGGCSNGGCYINPPIGQHTNGPCHCLDMGPKLRQAVRAIRRVKNALSDTQLKPQSAWQDISTAPRDGKSILVYDRYIADKDGHQISRDGYAWRVARWHEPNKKFESGGTILVNPTHWQPLPPKPEGAKP